MSENNTSNNNSNNQGNSGCGGGYRGNNRGNGGRGNAAAVVAVEGPSMAKTRLKKQRKRKEPRMR